MYATAARLLATVSAAASTLNHPRLLHLFGTRAQDMQRPLYMQPKDALAYGIIDGIVS